MYIQPFKKIILLALILLLTAPLHAQFSEQFLPTPGQFQCKNGRIALDNIMYGAVPNNSADNPVLVYVHGYIDNGYGWFFQKNKMYQKSYVNNYRTAFLGHPRTTGIYENGQMIADMLAQVAAHYNTNELVVIAHSKGGLDTEMAMIEYNAKQNVKAVITLSTPFQGVPLSDLYGLPILTPIINAIPILGPLLQQEGTTNLQTGFVQGVIRPYLDNHPNNEPEKFITLGGKGKFHKPNFPLFVPEDLPNILLYNPPICIDLPIGFINELLVKLFFSVTGIITDAMPTSIYTHGGNKNSDGIVPYYSSIRPGSTEYLDLNSNLTNLSHGDFLYAGEVWRHINPILSDLNDIIEANGRMTQLNEIEVNDYKEEYVSNLQIIDLASNSKLTHFDDNAKLLLVAEEGEVEIYDREYVSVDVSEDQIDNAPSYKTKEEMQAFVDLKMKGNQPITAYMIDSEIEMKAKCLFDAPKTFYIEDWTADKIQIDIPEILNEIVYMELTSSLDLKGNPFETEIIKIPLLQESGYMIPAYLPPNLDAGVYNARIIAKGQQIKGVLPISFVLKKRQQDGSQITEESSLNIYPNPSNDWVRISNIIDGEDSELKVYDLNGRLMLSEKINNQRLDISTLEHGVFIIEVRQNSNVIRGKLVKQ